MRNETDEATPSPEEARADLRDGLDKARRLVERARFMLGGESDESPA